MCLTSIGEWLKGMLSLVAMGVTVLALFGAALLLIGVSFENMMEYRAIIDACRRHAVTPYEYHQC